MYDLQAFYFRDFKNSYLPHILKEMYMDAIYEPFLQGKQDLTIFDLGSNIGIFSYYASQYGTVHSFEPSAMHMDTQRTMLAYNKLNNKVKTYQVALSEVDGTTTFYHNGNTTMFSLEPAVNSKPEEAETVETWTMKTAMEKAGVDHIDFMKLDVEGHEFKLMASQGFASVVNKIDTIVGEYHTWTNTNPDQMITMLMDYGYKAWWLNQTEATIFAATRL